MGKKKTSLLSIITVVICVIVVILGVYAAVIFGVIKLIKWAWGA